jgi:hypothetical protein
MGKLASNRVVDAHASELCGGYRPQKFAAVKHILKTVAVKNEAGSFMEFAADASVLRENLNRALGDARKRINMKVGKSSYAAGEVSLEVETIDRELRNVPDANHDDYARKKDELAFDSQLLLMEYSAAQIMKNTANYNTNNAITLSGSAQWQNSTATPIKNLRDWVWIIALQNGVQPGDLGIGFAPKPKRALVDSADARDRVKYTGKEVTLEALKSWLEVKECVDLTGMYASTFNPDDVNDVTFTTIFDDEVFVYIPVDKPTAADPLAGGIAEVGQPIVTRYRDEPKSADVVAVDRTWGIFWKPNNRKILVAKAVSGLPALV